MPIDIDQYDVEDIRIASNAGEFFEAISKSHKPDSDCVYVVARLTKTLEYARSNDRVAAMIQYLEDFRDTDPIGFQRMYGSGFIVMEELAKQELQKLGHDVVRSNASSKTYRRPLKSHGLGPLRQLRKRLARPPRDASQSRAKPGWDEGKVVRDDIGRFASKDAQRAAAGDVDKTAVLLARVTKPAERKKLIDNLKTQGGMSDEQIKQALQKASGQSGGSQEKTQATGNAAQDLTSKIMGQGGFTYQPVTGASPESGFSIAMFPEEEVIVDAKDLSPAMLFNYMMDRSDKFSDEKIHFGAWYNQKSEDNPDGDDKVYLDMSMVIDDQAEAERIAKENGQLGIYDLAGGKTIQTMTPDERAQWEKKRKEGGDSQDSGKSDEGDGPAESLFPSYADEPLTELEEDLVVQEYSVELDEDGDGVFDASRVGTRGNKGPVKKIPRMKNLTPLERAVEESFAEWYEKDPHGAAKAYREAIESGKLGDGPNIFNTDDAKMLSQDYAVAKENRSLYNLSVHQTANSIAKLAFVQKLDEIKKKPEGQRKVLITAGGVAAGKGFALEKNEDVKKMSSDVDAIWDSAGDQYSTELPWIHKQLEERGIEGTYVFVDSDPKVTYWNEQGWGAVDRAKKKGRMVDHLVHAESYYYGARNYEEFRKRASGTKAKFVVVDNWTGKPKVTEKLDIDRIPKPRDVERLNEENLRRSDAPDWVKRGALLGNRVWPEHHQAEAA